MAVRFPYAEEFARTMTLPLTACAATKELYGYAKPVLDEMAAYAAFHHAGIYAGPARDAAFEILNERVERLN